MSRKLILSALVMALLVAACGGGGDGAADPTTTIADPGEVTTAPAAPTTTEAPATTEAGDDDDSGPMVDLGDIPQHCIDAFVDFLKAIEPTVETVDWSTASLEDLERISEELDDVMVEYEEETLDAACDDIEVNATDEESFEYMLAIARAEAPGTVSYFEMIRDMAMGFGGSTGAGSGDCEADIAAIEAMIAEHGSMEHLSVADLSTAGGLIMSITSNCSAARAAEFFEREDVSNFLEG